MSRFFAGSSSDESESSDDEPQMIPKAAPITTRKMIFSSDEEEDTKRVVRSQKDKRFEEILNIIKQLKNHKKINDMAKVLTEFENLGRAFAKAKNVVDKEGKPRFFIRCLADLESYVKTHWEDTESRKKLSKVNAKALTSLRQKLRKYNRDFEEDISKYLENPDAAGVSDQEGSGSEDDLEQMEQKDELSIEKKMEPQSSKLLADDESDSDDDWSDEDEASSSDSDLEISAGQKYTAAMFLKKETDKPGTRKKPTKGPRKETKKDDKFEWKVVKGDQVTDKAKALFPKDTEITHPVVMKKLKEILAVRGKKGTDRTDQIEFLKELTKIADKAKLGPAMHIKLTFNIIASVFDYNPNVATCMKPEMWASCMEEIAGLFTALEEHPEVQVGDNILEELENLDNTVVEGQEPLPLKVRGSVLTVIERMDEEFTKMLQGCDCHSTEYVDRLKDEIEVVKLIERLKIYVEKNGTSDEICHVYLRKIEHMYYKVDKSEIKPKPKIDGIEDDIEEKEEAAEENEEKENVEKENEEKENEKKEDVEKESEEKENEKKEDVETESVEKTPKPNNSAVLEFLCKYIYAKDNTQRIRTRAMLCHIYHHALHDRWYEARDLMLMSHLQETIQHSDIPTQILYNRTMVQVGLCAFRHGMIKDAHACLHDIQSTGRAKELLAQGLMQQRQNERTPEQEKIEKRRQVPFHMHINLELLECSYLISAMLIEIPHMAAHQFDNRRRMISKSFHHQMRLSDKQTLVGPPESMREHVVAAAKAMRKGDWKRCRDYVLAIKVWKLLSEAKHTKKMLARKIQEESLRTYLFTYSNVYDSLSLHSLAEMFELPPAVVHSVISKMIINEELQASWDEPTQTVVLHRGAEPTPLQSLALQLAEKVGNLVDNNERLLEAKHGGFYQYKDRQGNYKERQSGYKDRQTGYKDRQGNYQERQSGYKDRQSGYKDRQGRYNRNTRTQAGY